MREINPDHIKALLDLINKGPYFQLLGIQICELHLGYSRVELDFAQKHSNNFGSIHGGVYSSIIDTAAYWAAYCYLDEDAGYTSLDVNVNNLAMIKSGKIIAKGHCLKAGKSICLCEATAKDATGRILAHGTSQLMVLQGKQSIAHALEARGQKPLSPKFL